MSKYLLLAFLTLYLYGFQENTKILPLIYTQVAGWNYKQYVIIDTGVMRKGIELTTTDSNYKVAAFELVYAPKNGEKIQKKIQGNKIEGSNFPYLQRIKPGDKLMLEHVKARSAHFTTEIYSLTILVKE